MEGCTVIRERTYTAEQGQRKNRSWKPLVFLVLLAARYGHSGGVTDFFSRLAGETGKIPVSVGIAPASRWQEYRISKND